MGLGPAWDGVREHIARAALNEAQRSLGETADDPGFPGALVPARSSTGRFTVYGVAEDGPAWRRLQPLLLAFAGPTVTSFDGSPATLDLTDPDEATLADAMPHAVARLRPGPNPDGDAVAVRALLRLRELLDRAPDLAVDRPISTSRLLASLQDALNVGDIGEAWRVHHLLASELRLDAANLVQLEVAILGTAGDWSGIRNHPRFDTLCASAPTGAVAELLLEATYRMAVAAEGGVATTEAVSRLRPYADLLLPHVPRSTREAVERVRDLMARREPDDASAPSPVTVPPSVADVATAQRALLDVAAAPDDPGTRQAALAAVDALTAGEREDLLRAPWLRALWLELTPGSDEPKRVRDWSDWLAHLPDETFDALAYARQAPALWRPADESVDPAAGRSLANAILSVSDGLAERRMDEALAYWVAWAEADPRWPRAAYQEVYSALLLRIALGARRGEEMLRSGATVLDGLLRVGLDGAEYREAIDAVGAIVASGLNRTSVYEVLNYLDVLDCHVPPDPAALATLREAASIALKGLFHRLSAAQRAAIGVAFGSDGAWPSDETQATDEGFANRLKGQRIGIYTLNESAGRQARDALLAAAPGVTVNLNHDGGGSQTLAASARGADLFVVAWATATHAATDFIKQQRGGRPLIYARGGGASSIVQAVEQVLKQEIAIPRAA